MIETVITANGDYQILDPEDFYRATTATSSVVIPENSAAATLIFGYAGTSNEFVGYPDGTFNDGRIIDHGVGLKLMVRASGISANTVTIRVYPS